MFDSIKETIETIIIKHKTNKLIEEFKDIQTPQEALAKLTQLFGNIDTETTTKMNGYRFHNVVQLTGEGLTSNLLIKYSVMRTGSVGTTIIANGANPSVSAIPGKVILDFTVNLSYSDLRDIHHVVKHIIDMLKPFHKVIITE